jgi:hypothetical protein
MQVPELVGDEVQAVEDDLGAWLHLLNFVLNLKMRPI